MTNTTMTSLLAWHGTRADGTTKHLKIKEVVGVKSQLVGDVEFCANALHGSIRAVDMLRYSEGLWFKRTLHEGVILQQSGKIGSSERTVVGEADATQVVSDWAFWCADRAVRIHAVAALRRAEMDTEAEKLVSLEAITDQKSAYIAAARVADAVITAAATDHAVAADAANSAARAANAANAVAHAAVATAHAVAADAANSAARAANAANAVAYTAAATVEMDFLNAELERRLLALMGLTETEVTQ